MKKRTKILIMAAIIFVITISGTLAAYYREEYKITPFDETTLIETGTISNTDKLKMVAEKILADTEDTDEAYNVILDYTYDLKKYKPSPEEENYLHDLILSGANAKMITQIYTFLQDTDYEIEMVKQIYDIGLEICEDDVYWIESAFNKVTGNRHGVLNKDDVKAYLQKGITAEEINTANIMCRKGKYTIGEILDKRVEGVDWEDIFDEVYGDVISENENGIKLSSFQKVKKVESDRTPSDMLEAVRLSKVSNQAPEVFLATQETKVDEYNSDINRNFIEESKNILSDLEIKENVHEETNVALLNKAKANGVTDEKIEECLKKGIDDLDILNASYIAKEQNRNFDIIIDEKQSGKSFDEIIEEGSDAE